MKLIYIVCSRLLIIINGISEIDKFAGLNTVHYLEVSLYVC